MLTAGQAAALIAAISFAVLAGAGVYALVKLARLITETSRTVAEMRERTDLLLGRANAAVDQAQEQLTRTGAVAASMDEVSSNVAELTADVSMLAGVVRTLLGGPLGRLAGFSYGVRRAIALRRAGAGAGSGVGSRTGPEAGSARLARGPGTDPGAQGKDHRAAFSRAALSQAPPKRPSPNQPPANQAPPNQARPSRAAPGQPAPSRATPAALPPAAPNGDTQPPRAVPVQRGTNTSHGIRSKKGRRRVAP
jgi:uncharacterized protein YoxC